MDTRETGRQDVNWWDSVYNGVPYKRKLLSNLNNFEMLNKDLEVCE